MEEPKNVEELFWVFPIELSVSARNLPQIVRFLAGGQYRATLFVKTPSSTEWDEVLQSEPCELDTNPLFLEKAWLPALDMENSFTVAQTTRVRVTMHSGRSLVGSAETTLAAILLRQAGDLSLIPRARKLRSLTKISSDRAKPTVSINAESFFSAEQQCEASDGFDNSGAPFSYIPGPAVQFSTQVDPLLLAAADDAGKDLSFAISRANRNGDWTVVYKSARRAKGMQGFFKADVARDILLGGDPERQLRITLHSFSKAAGSRLEGFLIFRLEELDLIHREGCGRGANLGWICMDEAVLNAGIECSSVDLGYDGATSIKFVFKHGRQVAAEQITAAAESEATARAMPPLFSDLSNGQDGSRVSSEEQPSGSLPGDRTSPMTPQEDGPAPWPRGNLFSRTQKSADSNGTTISSEGDSRSFNGRLMRPSSLYVPDEVPRLGRDDILSVSRRPSEPLMEVRFPGDGDSTR